MTNAPGRSSLSVPGGLVGLVLAVVVLGEALTGVMVLAAALILAGVALAGSRA